MKKFMVPRRKIQKTMHVIAIIVLPQDALLLLKGIKRLQRKIDGLRVGSCDYIYESRNELYEIKFKRCGGYWKTECVSRCD